MFVISYEITLVESEQPIDQILMLLVCDHVMQILKGYFMRKKKSLTGFSCCLTVDSNKIKTKQKVKKKLFERW